MRRRSRKNSGKLGHYLDDPLSLLKSNKILFSNAPEQDTRRIPDLSAADLREWMESNFCRCTGYEGIKESIAAASKAMRDKPVP